MIKSKQLKNTNIKGLKLTDDSDEKLSKLDIVVQKYAKKLDKIVKKILPKSIYYKIDVLDDLGMFKTKDALSFFKDRWFRILTFAQFRERLYSGWEYFKRGYKSFDFDSAYAMDDFLWKLERLAEVMKKNDRHYGDSQHVKQIKEVIRLIKRVEADDYLDEFEAQVTEKYGENIRYEARHDDFFNENKGPFKNKSIASSAFYKREKCTPEIDKEIRKAERAMYKKANAKRTREWKKALKIIEENFHYWWD